VQLVVREQSVSTATDRLAWCVRALTSSLPSKPEDPVNWRAFEAVLAHVDQLAALSTVKNPTGQQYRELLHACCSFLIASGSHLEAAARLERLVKTSSSDEPVFKARLYNELGGAYWSEARALMPKNKDAAKRSRTAQKRCDRLLRKAEKANRSALELTRENYPNDHSALARQFSNVGNAARDLKKYAEAKALFEDAICHEERASGLRSAQMAVRLNNLALCFLEERKWRRAAKLLEQAAEITAEAAGAESEPMVVRLFNLWQVYNKSRRRVLARRYLSNCVSLAQKILPRGHPKRVRAEAALAKLPRPLLKVLPARA
jgi:tetratricopeptide (TPR) repeat protein